MPNVIRAELVQSDWTGDKESMIDSTRSRLGKPRLRAQVMCFQELFYGPYFCQVQDAAYYDYTEEIPSGPTTRFLRSRELGMVMVLPMQREGSRGPVLQHRGRRRRRHYLRQVPQAAHPHVNGF
jgi:N-carbamoylputrescine amidase